VTLMLVRSPYRLRPGTMPSLGGQRRIYRERASWHDLPEHCAGSSTFIANSARLGRQVAQRRNSLPVIFLHQEGVAAYPSVLIERGFGPPGGVLVNLQPRERVSGVRRNVKDRHRV
jgi:hypothetical protein